MAGTRTRDAVEMPASQPRPDAYTGMLIVSLVATVAGLMFLWLDYSGYPDKEAPKPPTLSAPRVGAAAPAPEAPPK
jgi:hypothetical protein